MAGVPGIDYAAEAYGHNASNAGTDHEKRSEEVELREALFVRDTRSRVERGKHEKVYWGTECANEDFEGLSSCTTMTNDTRATHG